MDDGFHHRDDEAVLGMRATRVSGWEAKWGCWWSPPPAAARERRAS